MPKPGPSVTVNSSPPAVAPAKYLYFVNAPVDHLVVGLGSIVAYTVLLFVYGKENVKWLAELGLAMQVVVNHPHFAATNYRLYHSRENIRQYPLTALVIPWLVLLAVIGSFFSPAFIAVIFYKIFMYWSPYHFSGQTLGVTLIYARRAGFFVGRWERFTLSQFIYSTFLYMTARGDMITAAADVVLPSAYDVDQYRLGIPPWVAQAILVWMILNGLAFLALVSRWCLREKRILPPIVLLPVVTQFIWFIPGSWVPAFYIFVPMFHSLQYILIAWSMQLKERMELKRITPSKSYVLKETLRWGFINLVLGAILFYGVPKLIFNLQGKGPDTHSYFFVLGIIGAGIQIHHFFVDGVIWKLKKKTVSSPLMVNLDELIHPPATQTAGVRA
jgi:hypothetical protein